jgi:hypothetical protein
MGEQRGRVPLRLVLSALVCVMVLAAVAAASYGRLFSRSAEPQQVSPITRLGDRAPELDCAFVEAPDELSDPSDPPTWLTAAEAARSLVRAPGESVDWFREGAGLAVAAVRDAEGEVVRTASLLRLLPREGWTLTDVTQCVVPEGSGPDHYRND